MSLHIGDLVRPLRLKGQGIVRKLNEKTRIASVEMADGLTHDFPFAELAKVDSQEKAAFAVDLPKADSTKSSAPALLNRKGLFLAFVPIDKELTHYYLINQTDYEVVCSFGENHPSKFRGLFAGIIPPRRAVRNPDMQCGPVRMMPIFRLRGVHHQAGAFVTLPAFDYQLQIVASEWHARLVQNAPILDRAAHLFQFDTEQKELPSNYLDALREALDNNQGRLSARELRLKVPDLLDLHIDKLAPAHALDAADAILRLQLTAFQTTLENAIAAGMESLIVIHGIGNGILKSAIHKAASTHAGVAYYKEAPAATFGQGATLIAFK